MRNFIRLALLAVTLSPSGVLAQEREKLADDPTKIITKVGVNFSDTFSLSGSLAIGPVSKINARVSETGEWTLGGSYLFGFGIVNVAASRRDLSSGIQQTQYSIGSFAPVYRDKDNPAGWQVFASFGANYTEGQSFETELPVTNQLPITTTSRGGYLGVMALKPLSQKWVFRGFAMGSMGSGDYSGYGVGLGVSYSMTAKDSFGVMIGYSDNSFGQSETVGAGYQREF